MARFYLFATLRTTILVQSDDKIGRVVFGRGANAKAVLVFKKSFPNLLNVRCFDPCVNPCKPIVFVCLPAGVLGIGHAVAEDCEPFAALERKLSDDVIVARQWNPDGPAADIKLSFVFSLAI